MSAPGFYLLAAPVGDKGANSFLDDSPAGKALVAICGAIAVVIVVFGVFRMINGIGRGRPGEAFKSLIFALLIGGLLFNLNLTLTGVNMMGDLVGKVFSSVNTVSNSNN
ncbi:hypothetical protein ACQPZP_09325 [Spirillospora sp. CA-142024]|uniref:hypothetical protein n=1 Tax=unclassified Spirillospora TaxID=2642701 RepID=UPI003D94F90E